MALPPIVQRLFSFTGFAQGLGNGTFAGTQLDTDLDQTNNAVNDLTEIVRRVVRADGKLANGSVGRNALAADVQIGLGAARPWLAGSAYATNDTVTSGYGLYVANGAHTASSVFATDLAAGRWALIADLSQAVVVADGAITREKIGAKAVAAPQLEDRSVSERILGIGVVDQTHVARSLGVVPIGAEIDFAGVAPPSNWLWSNGALLSRFAYIPLFEALSYVVTCSTVVGSPNITGTAVPLGGIGLIGASVEGPGIPLGTVLGFVSGTNAVLSNPVTATATGVAIRIMPHGNGDGTTTFRLPDRRGRFSAGRDDMGGGPAGRLPSIAGERLAAVGGNEARILTLANLPVTLPGGAVTVTYPQTTYVTYGQLDVVQAGTGNNSTNLWRNTQNTQSPVPDPRTFNFGISNPGGGQAFNVLPPVGIANRIIFAGA